MTYTNFKFDADTDADGTAFRTLNTTIIERV